MYIKNLLHKALLFLVTAVFFSGCGTHINQFARFNLKNKSFFLKQYVSPDLTRVNVDIAGYYHDDNLISVILTQAGVIITENSVREKLQKSVNPDSLALAISEGISEGLKTYFYAEIAEDLDDNPQYIAETRLERFRITSNTSGIYAMIDTRVIITERGTAKAVWENTECSEVPIGDVIYDFTCNRYIRTTKGVINAVRLMQMSEDEIRAAVNIAAGESGKRQCDRLREDISGEGED